MPRLKKTWSSWNFLGSSGDGDAAAVCVTYWLNKLQVRRVGIWTECMHACVCICASPSRFAHRS